MPSALCIEDAIDSGLKQILCVINQEHTKPVRNEYAAISGLNQQGWIVLGCSALLSSESKTRLFAD